MGSGIEKVWMLLVEERRQWDVLVAGSWINHGVCMQCMNSVLPDMQFLFLTTEHRSSVWPVQVMLLDHRDTLEQAYLLKQSVRIERLTSYLRCSNDFTVEPHTKSFRSLSVTPS